MSDYSIMGKVLYKYLKTVGLLLGKINKQRLLFIFHKTTIQHKIGTKCSIYVWLHNINSLFSTSFLFSCHDNILLTRFNVIIKHL